MFVVRRPSIYRGFIIAFWSMPAVTIGRLLFAAATTAYILIGIALDERDLVDLFGDDYRRYRARASMLFPWRKSAWRGLRATHVPAKACPRA